MRIVNKAENRNIDFNDEKEKFILNLKIFQIYSIQCQPQSH